MRPPEDSPPRLGLVARLQAEIAAGTYDTAARMGDAVGGMRLQPLAMSQRTRPQLIAERDRCERNGELNQVLLIDAHLEDRS